MLPVVRAITICDVKPLHERHSFEYLYKHATWQVSALIRVGGHEQWLMFTCSRGYFVFVLVDVLFYRF